MAGRSYRWGRGFKPVGLTLLRAAVGEILGLGPLVPQGQKQVPCGSRYSWTRVDLVEIGSFAMVSCQ